VVSVFQLKDTGWKNGLKKQDPTIFCIIIYLTVKDKYRLRRKDGERFSKQMEPQSKQIFASYSLDEGLVSRLYNELTKNNLINKWQMS
jgi:hypothetical protein